MFPWFVFFRIHGEGHIFENVGSVELAVSAMISPPVLFRILSVSFYSVYSVLSAWFRSFFLFFLFCGYEL